MYAQTENTSPDEESPKKNMIETNNQLNDKNEDKNSDIDPENQATQSGTLIVIKPDDSIFSDPQFAEISRNAMAMILNISKSNNPLTKKQSASEFNLKELKQKARKKSLREMQAFNKRNNKKFNEIFQRFQKKRTQSANYSGRHYDYTSYIQNFQSPKRR